MNQNIMQSNPEMEQLQFEEDSVSLTEFFYPAFFL